MTAVEPVEPQSTRLQGWMQRERERGREREKERGRGREQRPKPRRGKIETKERTDSWVKKKHMLATWAGWQGEYQDRV